MAQRLVPCDRKDDVDRVPATEVLLNNSTVADKIRDGVDEDLPAVMAKLRRAKACTRSS
jgi:Tfp pilus assembly ATPase PilU